MGAVVFLDKDGTLVENVPYNVDPALVHLAPGAAHGLRRLAAAGFRLAVITNQPGVALGLFPESALDAVRARLDELLAACGVALSGFYYCPHHPDALLPQYATCCECRKPGPGLIRRAARELDASPSRSWVVGDILDDVEAGRRAGCRTVLIDNGNETEWVRTPLRHPDHVAPDLARAAELIVEAG